MRLSLRFILSLFVFFIFSDIRAFNEVTPNPKWRGLNPEVDFARQFTLEEKQRKSCRLLEDFVTGKSQLRSSKKGKLALFKTDGLVILHKGGLVFEHYDRPYFDANTPHVLWSASKFLTVTLLLRAIFEGAEYNGKKVTLDTPLHVFFPNASTSPRYKATTLRHVVSMSIPYNWLEFYDAGLERSTFLPMLYFDGRLNMSRYALSQPFLDIEPGKKLTYSGGNSNILMAVLRKIYPKDYDQLPWKLLFDPLGIKTARWERDESGFFVGSSYAYMSVRDMSRIGYLYLMEGMGPTNSLLKPSWVTEARQMAHSLTDSDSLTLPEDIEKVGAQSERVFYLNEDVVRGGKVLYTQDFPNAPRDMYFAAGHYGQLIIVVPSADLVIARTGHDTDYWWHIEPLVAKTIECLKEAEKIKETP